MHELAANHSLFVWAKFAAAAARFPVGSVGTTYFLCGAVLFVAVYFGKVRKLPVANQVLFVTLFMVMFPPISYFYTLTHLYAPWALLVMLAVRTERGDVRLAGLRGTILWFLPVFAAFTLFTFRHALLFGGLIQSAVMVFLGLGALTFRFEETEACEGRKDGLADVNARARALAR